MSLWFNANWNKTKDFLKNLKNNTTVFLGVLWSQRQAINNLQFRINFLFWFTKRIRIIRVTHKAIQILVANTTKQWDEKHGQSILVWFSSTAHTSSTVKELN